jgi:PPOX class probable F420-dependent enzyme
MENNGNNVIPEGYGDFLESAALAHIATLGLNGEPQNNPVWFDGDGEHLKFSQTKTRQEYRNVNRDPRIAIANVDPGNPYRYLEIRGEVERIEEDPDLDFINAMAKKYMGWDKYPYHQPGDERVVVYVAPRRSPQRAA